MGTYQDWFDVYKISEGTYAIYEPDQFEEVLSYLVLGEARGAIIDIGTGIGNIREVVERLTDLPVSVVLRDNRFLFKYKRRILGDLCRHFLVTKGGVEMAF